MFSKEEIEERNNKGKLIKKWEIWTGFYHLGQGYPPSSEPELVAVVKLKHLI